VHVLITALWAHVYVELELDTCLCYACLIDFLLCSLVMSWLVKHIQEWLSSKVYGGSAQRRITAVPHDFQARGSAQPRSFGWDVSVISDCPSTQTARAIDAFTFDHHEVYSTFVSLTISLMHRYRDNSLTRTVLAVTSRAVTNILFIFYSDRIVGGIV